MELLILSLLRVAGDTESLAVVIGVDPTLMNWDDVVTFQIGFRVGLVAVLADVVIS